jgi:hypothetical protein
MGKRIEELRWRVCFNLKKREEEMGMWMKCSGKRNAEVTPGKKWNDYNDQMWWMMEVASKNKNSDSF